MARYVHPSSRGLNADADLVGQKVLYLMVVNLPTGEEMSQAEQITNQWDVQSNSQQYSTTYAY